ncbi:recombinase family protein [Blastococcus sp. SYSU D00922]
MPLRAVLYCRLSVTKEDSTSIQRQEQDLRALAAREGWEVAEVLKDDGQSGGKERDKANAALAMLADGQADVLAVWKFDRWSRQGLGAVARLLEVLDKRAEAARNGNAAPAMFIAKEDGLRSGESSFEIIAGVLAGVARQERENTRLRVRSSIAELRRSGRYSGGNVPSGYRSEPNPEGRGRVLVPNPAEAEILREAAERIVTGASVYAVTAWMNSTSFRPRRAATWSITALQQALTGEAIVGRVRHSGQVLRGEDGLPLQVWEPVLPLDLWHSVRAALEARSEARRPAGQRRRGARSRLLSGLATCADCDGPLYVRTTGSGVCTYACSAKSNGRPCGGVSVTAERLEEFVADAFLGTFGRVEALEPVEVEAPAVALVEAERALAEVSARLGDPDLLDDEEETLFVQRRALRDRVRELRAEAAAPPRLEYVPTGLKIAEVWATDEDVQARRALLSSALHAVVVRKGQRGRRGLDSSRVDLLWRDGEPEDYNAP